MGAKDSKPLKYVRYEVMPTPGGNVVARRNNSYVDRIFFDETGTIWNIKSDEEFNSLGAKPFDNKEFTFGGVHFTADADYECHWTNTITRLLFNAKHYRKNDLVWDLFDAYKCNCTYDEDGILHPPPQGCALIEKYTGGKGFSGGYQILVDGKLYRTTGYDGVIYLNGKFYNNSRFHEEITLAEYPDAGDWLNLPNYTSILITNPPIAVEDFIIVTTPFHHNVLYMDIIPFDYKKCAFIQPMYEFSIYLAEIKTGRQICKMREESSCCNIFKRYGFKESDTPEHPYYLSFGQESPFDGASAKKIKLMARNNIYYAVGEKEICRGKVYSRASGSRTKAALRE